MYRVYEYRAYKYVIYLICVHGNHYDDVLSEVLGNDLRECSLNQ